MDLLRDNKNMTFHPWTLLYIEAALFSLGVGLLLLRSERKTLSKICLVSLLFIISAWAVLDFVNNFLDDTVTSTLILKLEFIILGFVSVLFFLIPYIMRHKINNKILVLFTIPIILAYIVLFVDDFATTEYLTYGYHINYNIPAVVTWSAVYIATLASGFYLFYKIYSDTLITGELKNKIKYFCAGSAIAGVMAFGLNIFLIILYDIPPLGSIFTSIGVGIVFLCFKL